MFLCFSPSAPFCNSTFSSNEIIINIIINKQPYIRTFSLFLNKSTNVLIYSIYIYIISPQQEKEEEKTIKVVVCHGTVAAIVIYYILYFFLLLIHYFFYSYQFFPSSFPFLFSLSNNKYNFNPFLFLIL